MSRESMVLNFIEMGVHFGYPSCCIAATIDRYDAVQALAMKQDMDAIQTFVKEGEDEEWYGTGFVPCPVCRATIKRDGLKLFVAQKIAPARKAPEPFPEG